MALRISSRLGRPRCRQEDNIKIAIATHGFVHGDGQGRVAYETVRRALALGHDLTLIATRVEKELLQEGAHWISVQPKLPHLALPLSWEFPYLADRALKRLQAQGERFDIVQAFGYTLTRPHQINMVQFVHDAWSRSPVHVSRSQRNMYGLYQWIYSQANKKWEQQSFRQAQIVVAASQLVRTQLAASGVPEDRLRVILNGVNLEEFHPGPGDRPALGLPEGVSLALFAGDIRSTRKNLDSVLKALSDVPGLHLAVVGALEGSPFPALAKRLGVAERVHFLGFRRDIAAIMRSVDLFAFPSRYEACSLVILEALASGLPVITAQSAGGAEIVTPEAGVVLDDPDDVSGLTTHLCRLAHDLDLRYTMGKAARAVAEQHSWQQMADQYLALYEEVSRQ